MPSGVKRDDLVRAFDPVLQEAAFLDVGNVHVFEADVAAVVGAQDLDQAARGDPFEAERAADIDLAVERRAGEAVPLER